MAADWFYAANGQQHGPVELHVLQGMVSARTLAGSDLVFGPGVTDWTPVANVPALSAGLGGLGTGSLGDANLSGANPSLLTYRGVETATTGMSVLALEKLRQTKPWVRFMAVMAFIFAGLMALAGAVMLAAGVMTRGRGSGIPPYLGGIYVVLALLYVFPGILLNRYASGIARLMQTRRMSDVEVALGAQKSFWKFAGIMLIVVMCLYAVGIAAMIIFQVMK